MSFVEQATLLVRDKASGPIRKINKSLRDLERQSRRLRKMRVSISGLEKETAQVRKLRTELQKIPTTKAVRVTASGIAQAEGQTRRLRTQLSGIHSRNIQIGVSTAGAKAGIERIRRDMLSLPKSRTLMVKVNAGTGKAGVQKVKTALATLPKTKTITIVVNSGKAKAAIAAVKAQLTALPKTKTTMVKVNTGSATNAISALKTKLAALPKTKTITIRTTQTGAIPGAGGKYGPRALAPTGAAGTYRGGAAASPRAVFAGAFNGEGTPRMVASAVNVGLAYMTVRGAANVARAAGKAGVQGQAEETIREIVVSTDADREAITSIARQAAAETTHVSLTRAEKITRDLYTTGFRGDVLEALAPHVAQLEATARAVVPDRADSVTTLANKIGNLAAVTEDPARAKELTTGAVKAAVVQGETFNMSTLIRALRTSGTAQTMSDQGLLRLALSVDEIGRSTGSGVQRMIKLLTTDIKDAGAGGGVAVGTIERLISSGVRGAEGLSPENMARLMADPLGYIATEVGKMAEDKGLDPTDVKDRSTVKQLLTDIGFVGAEAKVILNELSAAAEREKALTLANSLDPGRLAESGADDLMFQLKNLAQQFKSFASETLDPIFSSMAPMAESISGFIQDLSVGEDSDTVSGQLKRLGAAAGTVAGTLVTLYGVTKGVGALGNLLTGGKTAALTAAGPSLLSAGGSLQAAAASLQAAAGAQGGVGKGNKLGKGAAAAGGAGAATTGSVFGYGAAAILGAASGVLLASTKGAGADEPSVETVIRESEQRAKEAGMTNADYTARMVNTETLDQAVAAVKAAERATREVAKARELPGYGGSTEMLHTRVEVNAQTGQVELKTQPDVSLLERFTPPSPEVPPAPPIPPLEIGDFSLPSLQVEATKPIPVEAADPIKVDLPTTKTGLVQQTQAGEFSIPNVTLDPKSSVPVEARKPIPVMQPSDPTLPPLEVSLPPTPVADAVKPFSFDKPQQGGVVPIKADQVMLDTMGKVESKEPFVPKPQTTLPAEEKGAVGKFFDWVNQKLGLAAEAASAPDFAEIDRIMAEGAAVDIPKATVDVNAPGIPEIKAPILDVPKIEAPTIDVPKIEAPTIDAPRFQMERIPATPVEPSGIMPTPQVTVTDLPLPVAPQQSAAGVPPITQPAPAVGEEAPASMSFAEGLDMSGAAEAMQMAMAGGAEALSASTAAAGQQLAAGGQQAAAVLQGAASGIGNAIGSAAAAVISAANVNVNVSGGGGGGGGGGGADTGSAN